MKKRFNSERLLKFLMNNKALIILILFVIFVNFLTPNFFTSRNLTNIMRQICTNCVLAVGFALILSSGNIDLSIGYMLGMIGIFTGLMAVAGVNMWVCIGVGIATGAVCGLLNAFLIITFKLPGFIVTLATGMIFQGINLLVCHAKSVANLPEWYKFFGTGNVGPIPFPILLMIIIVIVVAVIIGKTKFGRHALACGGNRDASRVCGINTNKIQYLVYMLAGICVGISALLLTGRTASAQTGAGAGMELDAVAAVVIGGTPMSGGKANVFGALIGCLLVQVIANSLNLLGVDSNWQKVAKGIVIIVAIILDSQGELLLNRLRARQAA